MLQPLYVFIIFVLKRNVIDMILGKDKKIRQSKIQSEEKELSLLSHNQTQIHQLWWQDWIQKMNKQSIYYRPIENKMWIYYVIHIN